jgi:hypothetical protein
MSNGTPRPHMAAILDEMKRVLTERRGNYAPPYLNFRRIAARMTLTLEHKLKPGERINILEVAQLMNDLKAGRFGHDMATLMADDSYLPHEDTPLDTGGYAVCAVEMLRQIRDGEIDVYGNVISHDEAPTGDTGHA